MTKLTDNDINFIILRLVFCRVKYQEYFFETGNEFYQKKIKEINKIIGKLEKMRIDS